MGLESLKLKESKLEDPVKESELLEDTDPVKESSIDLDDTDQDKDAYSIDDLEDSELDRELFNYIFKCFENKFFMKES